MKNILDKPYLLLFEAVKLIDKSLGSNIRRVGLVDYASQGVIPAYFRPKSFARKKRTRELLTCNLPNNGFLKISQGSLEGMVGQKYKLGYRVFDYEFKGEIQHITKTGIWGDIKVKDKMNYYCYVKPEQLYFKRTDIKYFIENTTFLSVKSRKPKVEGPKEKRLKVLKYWLIIKYGVVDEGYELKRKELTLTREEIWKSLVLIDPDLFGEGKSDFIKVMRTYIKFIKKTGSKTYGENLKSKTMNPDNLALLKVPKKNIKHR